MRQVLPRQRHDDSRYQSCDTAIKGFGPGAERALRHQPQDGAEMAQAFLCRGRAHGAEGVALDAALAAGKGDDRRLEPALVLTELETNILDRLISDPTADPSPARTLSLYLIKIARLGGYLARAKDPPPGNIVMWRGISRLNDIALGANLKINNVGN